MKNGFLIYGFLMFNFVTFGQQTQLAKPKMSAHKGAQEVVSTSKPISRARPSMVAKGQTNDVNIPENQHTPTQGTKPSNVAKGQ